MPSVSAKSAGSSHPMIVAQALDQIRSRGHRMTTARRVVIEALAAHPGHPTAEDLSTTIAERYPAIHRATVYRTLETLSEMGVVAHVHFGHGAAAYHLMGSSQDVAHLHALCHRCGSVFDLPGSLMDAVAERVREEIGFELEASHHALSGVCRECSSADPPSGMRRPGA